MAKRQYNRRCKLVAGKDDSEVESTPQEEQSNRALTPFEFCEQHYNPMALFGKSLAQGVRNEWPKRKPTEHSLLYAISHEHPAIYTSMLGMLMMGGTLKSAAALLGVSYMGLMDWLRRGASDLLTGVDTYYSRLMSDVHAATGYATMQREQRIAIDDPLAWLSRGPGKQFHEDTGLWQPTNTLNSTQLQGENPLAPLAIVVDATEDTVTDDALEHIDDAVKHLEQLNISNQFAFTKQVNEQYRRGDSATNPTTPTKDK